MSWTATSQGMSWPATKAASPTQAQTHFIEGMTVGEATTPYDRLAQDMEKSFNQVKSLMLPLHQEWIGAIRQVRGEYEPEVEAAIKQAGGSKIFANITGAVCASAKALILQLMDSGTGYLWDVKPTPVPELEGFNMDLIMEALGQAAAEAQTPQEQEQIAAMALQVREEYEAKMADARERTANMKKEMADQLAEMRWERSFVENLDDLTVLGSLIVQGPLAREKRPRRWAKIQSGEKAQWKLSLRGWEDPKEEALEGETEVEEASEYAPYFKILSPFQVYLDPGITSHDDLDILHIRHVMNRHQFRKLRGEPGFNADAVDYLLDLYSGKGNWVPETWESAVNGNSYGADAYSRFVVLETWAFISGADLLDAGVPGVTQDMAEKDCLATIWHCAGKALKVSVSNLCPLEMPLRIAPYYTVHGRIFGQGIPHRIRHSQAQYNAANRAEVDNMAFSVGPMIGGDLSKLAPNTDPTTLYPLKRFWFENLENGGGIPLQFFQPASNTQQMEEIKRSVVQQIQKETNLPDFAMGIPGSAQHNRTAEGLAMQQNAALSFIRSVIGNLDVFLTEPMVEALYHWNMEFNPKDSIKGDMDVVALGVRGAVAKDVLNNRLSTIMMNGLGDELKYWLRGDKATQLFLRGTGLEEEGVVNTPEQALAAKNDEAMRKAETEAMPKRMQPVIPPPNAALEILGNTPETSPLYGPAYETALEANGFMQGPAGKRFRAALNAVNEASVALVKGAIVPKDAADLATDLDPLQPPPAGAPEGAPPPQAAAPAGPTPVPPPAMPPISINMPRAGGSYRFVRDGDSIRAIREEAPE